MRLLALAVAATLFAAGFGIAEDKKPDVKKDEPKTTKTDGKISKLDGDKKITVKGEKDETTFTTDSKTKYYQDAPAEKKEKEDKKADKPKPTEINWKHLKEGDSVTVVATADKLATEVWVHVAKKDAPKGDK